jgi:thiamine-phosphate pyrophosphorylase
LSVAHFPRGLYAVTPDEADTVRLVRNVQAALAGGARSVQYRNKQAPADLQREQAAALREICRAARAPLIINDNLALALDVGADGVHLGRDDGDPAAARARLGPGAFLGVSCYGRLELASQAVALGADYVAFGSAFPSPTKPDAVRAPLALYATAKRTFSIPVIAIGGITLHNARALIDAGADSIAVISALFEADDIEARARAFQRMFERAG